LHLVNFIDLLLLIDVERCHVGLRECLVLPEMLRFFINIGSRPWERRFEGRVRVWIFGLPLSFKSFMPLDNCCDLSNVSILLLLDLTQETIRIIRIRTQVVLHTVADPLGFHMVGHVEPALGSKRVLLVEVLGSALLRPKVRIVRVVVLPRARLLTVESYDILAELPVVVHVHSCLNLLILQPVQEVQVDEPVLRGPSQLLLLN